MKQQMPQYERQMKRMRAVFFLFIAVKIASHRLSDGSSDIVLTAASQMRLKLNNE